MRTADWRYIRYANGDEELYDHRTDQYEWKNLAQDPAYAGRIKELAGFLPKSNAKATPPVKKSKPTGKKGKSKSQKKK